MSAVVKRFTAPKELDLVAEILAYRGFIGVPVNSKYDLGLNMTDREYYVFVQTVERTILSRQQEEAFLFLTRKAFDDMMRELNPDIKYNVIQDAPYIVAVPIYTGNLQPEEVEKSTASKR